jgi:hypothetical protein
MIWNKGKPPFMRATDFGKAITVNVSYYDHSLVKYFKTRKKRKRSKIPGVYPFEKEG